MRRYMIQIKYNVTSTQGLVRDPQNRKPQAATQVTPLYSMDEAVEAMRIAGTIDYKAPSS